MRHQRRLGLRRRRRLPRLLLALGQRYSTTPLLLLFLPLARAAHGPGSPSHNYYPAHLPPPSSSLSNSPPPPFHRRGGGFFPPQPVPPEPQQWVPPPSQQQQHSVPLHPLPAPEAAQDKRSTSSESEADLAFRVQPREVGLYERLGVAPNATMKQIARAYRRRARALHPDKRQDEDEEEGSGRRGDKEFVALTEAYALLSSHATRLQYHYHGLAAAEATAAMASSSAAGGAPATAAATPVQPPPHYQHPPPYFKHPPPYFTPPPPPASPPQPPPPPPPQSGWGAAGQIDAVYGMVERYFGGGRFRHLTGELPTNWLVSPATRPLFDAFDHDARIHQLALNLAGRLAPLVVGQPSPAALAAFERAAFEEAQALRAESMGPQLLGILGFTYERCGRKALRRLSQAAAGAVASSEAAVHHVKGKARAVGNYLSVASSGLRLLLQLRARAAHGYSSGEDPQVTPALLDALWAMNKVEIERAVASACKCVLRDPTQTVAALEARAQGLISLGQVFSAVGRMDGGGGGGYR